MKKFTILILLIMGFIGCEKRSVILKEKHIDVENIPKVLEFQRKDTGELIFLTSLNNFETALLSSRNKLIELKEVASGSGVRMIGNNEKTEIHFKNKEGVLLTEGKEINISLTN